MAASAARPRTNDQHFWAVDCLRASAGLAQAAQARGFVNTVVITAPQVTSYLIEHAPQLQADPYTG